MKKVYVNPALKVCAVMKEDIIATSLSIDASTKFGTEVSFNNLDIHKS